MKKKFLCSVILVFSVVFLSTAHAALYDFNTGISGFTAYGYAAASSGAVQLTAPSVGQYGSIFLDTPLNATAFNASFDFKIGEPNYPYSGDGITFAWVTAPGVGGGGGQLGFTGLTGYMVEFDHYWNEGCEPPNSYKSYDDTDHIAVAQAVNTPLSYFNLSFNLENNVWRHVDIAFNNGQIQVQMDGTEYINYVIAGYTGFNAYFGFTGSTGASYSRQLVDNFEINAVPAPATLLLLGSGLAGLAGFRRKGRKK